MKLKREGTPLLFSLIFPILSLVHGRVHYISNNNAIALPPSISEPPSSDSTSNLTSAGAQPPSPSLSFPPSNVFDVTTLGAVGDGITDDTEAFKNAWVLACQSIGSGYIIAPNGYSFMIQSMIFTGPCQGKIIFQINGIVMPPDGPNSWPPKNSKRQWLVFYRADGMSLIGSGLIDGRGHKWWNLPCKPHKGNNNAMTTGNCDSPAALRFFMSSNLRINGIKIQNSPQFHFRFDNCDNVNIDSITISSPSFSPNTDGIHVENTNNVGIYNSVISNGDDCISIGSGSFNVDIQNVTCGPSHGISIGSLGKQNTRACVANVTVRNAAIKHSDNGVRIKTWQGGSGSIFAVKFDGIKMDGVRNPIIIDQYYCLSKPCPNQTSALHVSGIQYSNIKGTYDIRSPPIHLSCSDDVPCTNITLNDVSLRPAHGERSLAAFCWNAYGTAIALTDPPTSCLLQGAPRQLSEYESYRCY